MLYVDTIFLALQSSGKSRESHTMKIFSVKEMVRLSTPFIHCILKISNFHTGSYSEILATILINTCSIRDITQAVDYY